MFTRNSSASAVIFVSMLFSDGWIAPAVGQTFTDISATAGIGLTSELTESLAWGDYDNDGDPDLYLTVNGPNHLFRNDGGGVFTDVTAEAGVGVDTFSVGTAFGDLDNDGDLDLYVVTFSTGTDLLYRNDGPTGPGGAYVFTDVTALAGVTIERSSRGMGYIDFDEDGLLDIYVNSIGDDILYHNLGNLQFQDVAASSGILNIAGQGVGVVPTDIDNDGLVDLFTGNRSSDLNRLFLNDGGTFSDITVSGGIDNLRKEGEQWDLPCVPACLRTLSDQCVDPGLDRGNCALDGLYLLENYSPGIVDSLYVGARIRERKRD